MVHGLHVGAVERGGVDVVLVGQTRQQVARAGAAVPHVVVLLPVFAQFGSNVLLREFHPARGGEERAFTLAHVLRHEQVAAAYDVVPILAARRTRIAVPKAVVRLLVVGELCARVVFKAEVVHAAVQQVMVVLQQNKEFLAQRLVLF